MSVWGTPPHKMSVIGSLWYIGMYLTICNKFYSVWARADLAYFLEPSYLVCLTTPPTKMSVICGLCIFGQPSWNLEWFQVVYFWYELAHFWDPISVAPLTTLTTNDAPDPEFLLREVTKNAKISKHWNAFQLGWPPRDPALYSRHLSASSFPIAKRNFLRWN